MVAVVGFRLVALHHCSFARKPVQRWRGPPNLQRTAQLPTLFLLRALVFYAGHAGNAGWHGWVAEAGAGQRRLGLLALACHIQTGWLPDLAKLRVTSQAKSLAWFAPDRHCCCPSLQVPWGAATAACGRAAGWPSKSSTASPSPTAPPPAASWPAPSCQAPPAAAGRQPAVADWRASAVPRACVHRWVSERLASTHVMAAGSSRGLAKRPWHAGTSPAAGEHAGAAAPASPMFVCLHSPPACLLTGSCAWPWVDLTACCARPWIDLRLPWWKHCWPAAWATRT